MIALSLQAAEGLRVQIYDPALNDNYRAYAYFAIRGAVLMACRRRAYREATHEPLEHDGNGRLRGLRFQDREPVDDHPSPEYLVLKREEERRLVGSQRFRLFMAAVADLPDEERDVVRLVLAGVDVLQADRTTRARLASAVRKLKRALAPTSR